MSYAPNYAWVGAPAVYNGTGGSGGDSAVENLNQWFDPGDQGERYMLRIGIPSEIDNE